MKFFKSVTKTALVTFLLMSLTLVFSGGCTSKDEEAVSGADAPKEVAEVSLKQWNADDPILKNTEHTITYGDVRRMWTKVNGISIEEFDAFADDDKVTVFSRFSTLYMLDLEARERELEKTDLYAAKVQLWSYEHLPALYWEQEIYGKIKPTDETVLQYIPPALDSVMIRIIVSKELDEAKKIYQRIVDGEDMVVLAAAESQGLLKKKAGLTSWLDMSNDAMFAAPVTQRFLDAELGSVLEPFYHDVGFLVVRIEEKKSSEQWRVEALELQRDEIVAKIRNEDFELRMDKWFADAEVKAFQENVEKFPSTKDMSLEVVEIAGRRYTAGEVFNNEMSIGTHGSQPYMQVIEKFIERALTTFEAEKLGIDSDPVYIEKRKIVSYEILSELLIGSIVSEINETPVTDEEFRGYYDTNIKKFSTEETRAISVMQFMTQDLALEGIARLDGGENFAELAKEISIDTESAEGGGAIGSYTKGKLLDELSPSVFALEEGQYTQPIFVDNKRVGASWFVVRADTVLKAAVAPFESAKSPKVAGRIKASKRANILDKLLKELFVKFGYETCY